MSDIRSSMSSIPEENWNAIDWSDKVKITDSVKPKSMPTVQTEDDTQEC